MKPIIIFDWDGVIYDSNTFKWGRAWQLTFDGNKKRQQYVQEIQDTPEGRMMNRYEVIRNTLLRDGVTEVENLEGENLLKHPEVLDYAQKFSNILRNPGNTLELFDKALTTLDELNRKGFTMYVISGTVHEDLQQTAKRLQVNAYFKELYGYAEEQGVGLGKYANFLKIQKIEGDLPAEDFIVVGDGFSDFELAKQISCPFYGIANKWNGWKMPMRKCDTIINSISELPALL